MLRVASTIGESLIWQPAIYLANKFSLSHRNCAVKLEFHDADTDTDILADTSDTRYFLKLFLWQVQRHADILATILASMSARKSVSVSVSVSTPWNASFSSRK